MLTVSQSAEMLGVSGARVRVLIKEGVLPAKKVGCAWLLEEKDVLQRASKHPKAGRPAREVREEAWLLEDDPIESRSAEGHALYLACKEYFQYRPSGEVISQADSAEEASFYMAVADFFLQQRQAQLVAEGVY